VITAAENNGKVRWEARTHPAVNLPARQVVCEICLIRGKRSWRQLVFEIVDKLVLEDNFFL